MELPIYKLLITDDEDIEFNYVAIVDTPATQSYAAYFSAIPDTVEHTFQVIDEARNIVGGYLMIADRPIKRVTKKGEEYFVFLDAENIDKAMIKFYEKGYQNNVNISHDKARKVEGMTLYQHFIINREMGIKAPKGFETEKDGSSFGFFKVKNKEVMDLVKSNKFGFSIEGMFKQEPVLMVSEDDATAIMNTLKKLHDKKLI